MSDALMPSDSTIVPRFAGHVSFFRLPIRATAEELDIAVCGVPFDGGSTNKAGARQGPRQIREMSHNHLRPVHPVTNRSPFESCRVADIGDVAVHPLKHDESLERIEAFIRAVRKTGARPLAAGGDHLISLPILRALAPGREPLSLIHFDSHTDTYDSIFGGKAQYDNGTPFRRAAEEGLIDPKRSIQIGIRGSRFGLQDLEFSLEAGFRVVDIDEFFELGIAGVLELVHATVAGHPAYLSFDVDMLDAVHVPGTGAPEIGGPSTREAQLLLRGLCSLALVGADVVEVCPPLDPSGMTALVAANLMFEILNVMTAGTGNRHGS